MAYINIINEVGEPEERRAVSKNASIEVDGDTFEPAVVQRVEYDHQGQSSSITTVCGETENRRESDEKPEIAVEGILTEDQIEDAKQLKSATSTELISDVHSGNVFVKRLTIGQESDLIEFKSDDTDDWELAFSFQLQLKQPE